MGIERQTQLYRDLAFKVRGSFANKYAEDDFIKTLIKVFESITCEEAVDLIRTLKPDNAFGDSVLDRLTRLMAKLEAEGQYVDANTCWLALEKLGANDPRAWFSAAMQAAQDYAE